MPFEGGFQGRTNKLVDGCYSFWQGGAFPLVHMVLTKQGGIIYNNFNDNNSKLSFSVGLYLAKPTCVLF